MRRRARDYAFLHYLMSTCARGRGRNVMRLGVCVRLYEGAARRLDYSEGSRGVMP